VVYGGGCEGVWERRSGERESGFRFGQRAEPHAHGLCDAGFEQDFYVEHSVGDGEHWEKVRPSLPSGPPTPAGGPTPGPFPAEWSQFLVTVGAGSEGFDVSPDGKELWAANAQAGTIAVINIAEKSLARTINAGVRGANRLKFTPDGRLVFVSSLGGADVAVLDVGLKEVVKRIPVGHGAAGIQMEPNGARAFVACTPDNYVAVIDLKTLAVTGKIDAGGNRMGWLGRRSGEAVVDVSMSDAVVKDPNLMSGELYFRRTRVPFKILTEYLEGGIRWTGSWNNIRV